MEYVYLVVLLALVEYFVFGGLVGRARAKYGVKAPACEGPDEFNRTFRVHQNTLEWLAVFVPCMWLFGTFVSSLFAAGIGAVGVIGRAVYAKGYIAAAEKRGPGMMLSGFANVALLLGSLVGVILALF
ncbi:MAG TPA: MAPEG family protein [Gammaproteobacteria bacterium]|nr:MAPEG family protein [Gammaproteobacteria bacterium]